MKEQFKLHSLYQPQGDQPDAIGKLVRGVQGNHKYQTLLGVTGSGKTFTIANVIEQLQLPTLVVAPNKTLAAQLYAEFRDFFPENKVEYFVSYYDYYQPEAYVPGKDLYIEKDADINEEIERMRQSTVRSLIERRDVLVVASVSCIYGWQEPEDYLENRLKVVNKEKIKKNEFLRKLIALQYERNDLDFKQGCVRVRGSVMDIFPAESEDEAVKIIYFGDEVEKITIFHPLSGKTLRTIDQYVFFQAKPFVTNQKRLLKALPQIRQEMDDRVHWFKTMNRWIEAERLEQRTLYDMELLETMGTCPGVENYSRHLAGRKEGATPSTIIDYFPANALFVIDESHISLPQIKGMYKGDQHRKQNLVDFGFRLPSALDNRPLHWEEFEKKIPHAIFVSATPASFELELSKGRRIDQIIRPTGLVDPALEVRSTKHQINDLLHEIQNRKKKRERVLITTLTKRMAEDLSYYLLEHGIAAKYLHSDIDTIERVELLQSLRRGDYDCLVGINLLREGLDLPEVSLVVIMDADKEGFLRSHVALIQTIGRAARNLSGKVILFADQITPSMDKAIKETQRRRAIQLDYNQQHHIHAESIQKAVKKILDTQEKPQKEELFSIGKDYSEQPEQWSLIIRELEEQMHEKAVVLDFEEAAKLRDRIKVIKKQWEENQWIKEAFNDDRSSLVTKRTQQSKRRINQARRSPGKN